MAASLELEPHHRAALAAADEDHTTSSDDAGSPTHVDEQDSDQEGSEDLGGSDLSTSLGPMPPPLLFASHLARVQHLTPRVLAFAVSRGTVCAGGRGGQHNSSARAGGWAPQLAG